MLEQAAGLPPRTLAAIADRERRVVEAEGGRLKLEWRTLRHRSGDRVEDLLWWEGDRLLGFLGIYGFESSPELAGMVSLLIVPRPSAAGKRLALRRGGTSLSSRACSSWGFGEPAPSGLAERLDSPRDRTSIVELSGSAVGTLRFRRDGDDARIYRFVIDPSWQGRGLGRAALRHACEQLRAEGAHQIGLEVDVENDRALTVYTSVGFAPILTGDYDAWPVS